MKINLFSFRFYFVFLTLFVSGCQSGSSVEAAYENCVKKTYEGLLNDNKNLPAQFGDKIKESFKEGAKQSCSIIKDMCSKEGEMNKRVCEEILKKYK